MADEEWIECKTPGASGRVYYINKESGKISWTAPEKGKIVLAKGAASMPKKSPRWSALSSTIMNNSGEKAGSDSPTKASTLIRNLLSKRRDAQKETDTLAPTSKKPASPFTKNKNAYRDALARARRMVQEATALTVEISPNPSSSASPSSLPAQNKHQQVEKKNETEKKKKRGTLFGGSEMQVKSNNRESSTPAVNIVEGDSTSQDKGRGRLFARAKRIILEWRRKTCGRWFSQWYRNAAKITARLKENQMKEKIKQSENALRLSEARSELALARCEVDSWRRAKSEKDALVRKMAISRLKKWEKSMNNRTKLSFEKWRRFIDMERIEDIKTLKSIVKKQTRETALYKTAMKDAKKKHKAAMKQLSMVQAASPDLTKGKTLGPETPGRPSVDNSVDTDSPGGARSAGLGSSPATGPGLDSNVFKLEADNKRLSRQVESLTAECNSLIQGMKSRRRRRYFIIIIY